MQPRSAWGRNIWRVAAVNSTEVGFGHEAKRHKTTFLYLLFKEGAVSIKKTMLAVLILAAVEACSPSRAHADERNKLTYLTFSQAVAVPGVVLPAGTYTFRLADSLGDRNIVQIFNHTGTQLITTILTIADYRLTPSDGTVITFGEQSGNAAHHALVLPRQYRRTGIHLPEATSGDADTIDT
jgi:hypothetical protein